MRLSWNVRLIMTGIVLVFKNKRTFTKKNSFMVIIVIWKSWVLLLIRATGQIHSMPESEAILRSKCPAASESKSLAIISPQTLFEGSNLIFKVKGTAWRQVLLLSSPCGHGILQCSDLVATENKPWTQNREEHFQFQTRAIYGLHPACNKQYRHLPLLLASNVS
jgi:hypothetical protein